MSRSKLGASGTAAIYNCPRGTSRGARDHHLRARRRRRGVPERFHRGARPARTRGRRRPAGQRRGSRGRARLVLRARRGDRAARRRDRLRGGRRSGRRCRARARAAQPCALVRPSSVADPGRGRRHHGRRPPPRPRARPHVPARSRRRRAVADRREHRDQRRRAARLQVRRHREVGDGPRGRRPSGRADHRRRRDAQGRGRLRPEEPADRVGGDARDRHRGLAPARPRARGRVSGRRLLRQHCRWVRARSRGSSAAGSRSPRSSTSTAGRSTRRARRFPSGCREGAGFLVIAEADGSADEAARLRDETVSVLGEGALSGRRSLHARRGSRPAGAGATA